MDNRRKIMEHFEEQKDFFDGKVNAGIEANRKGYAAITIKDKDNNPVKGAKIIVNQKTHEFKFGANLFMLDELETPEKNELYKRHFAETFNMATLPFYWDATEPEKGKTRYAKDSERIYRRPAIDLCMEFCEENGIEPREHALAYDRFFPEWLKKKSVSEIKAAYENRCAEIAERYKDRIPTIEVTNEMYWPSECESTFYDEPDFVEWCFKTAEKYFPANQLVINEATDLVWKHNARATDPYYSCIEANKLKGARIDAVGMQYHMFYRAEDEYNSTRQLYNPESLYKHMDLYAKLGPLQITEVTIPAYSDAPEDEELQAEILEKLYRIWFSHPAMEQIIYWNLTDGYAYNAEPGDMSVGENYFYGGLLRFDMSPKPAYYAIKNLIQKEWHTEAEAETNDSGKARFKGFYGKYDVEITVNGVKEVRELNLSKKGCSDFEFVI